MRIINTQNFSFKDKMIEIYKQFKISMHSSEKITLSKKNYGMKYAIFAFIFLLFSLQTQAQNTAADDSAESTKKSGLNTVRFGISYSALNTMFFSNGHLKDNRQVSLSNIQTSLDYFLTQNSFITLNFGYNFYSYNTGDVYLLYDEHIDHFYGQILYSQYIEDVYWGAGLGFSYTYHICEYEYEVYKYYPMLGEYLHVDNEYYLFQQRNSSLDLTFQVGMDVSSYFNFGIKTDIALLNLRDEVEDFSNKITIGITIGLKYPALEK